MPSHPSILSIHPINKPTQSNQHSASTNGTDLRPMFPCRAVPPRLPVLIGPFRILAFPMEIHTFSPL